MYGHTGEEREHSFSPYRRGGPFVIYLLHNIIVLSYLGLLGPFPTLHHSCGAGCDALRLPKEVVCTNTGAQVDFENAPRVLHLAVSCVPF